MSVKANETGRDRFIAKLAAMHEPTDTVRRLASKFGMTPGAVSGHYNRNPELRTLYPLAGATRNRKEVIRSKRLPFDQIVRLQARKNRQEGTVGRRKPLAALDTGKGRFALPDLPSGCCKWPYGDTGAFTFCGEAVTDTGSYCPAHAARSIRSAAV